MKFHYVGVQIIAFSQKINAVWQYMVTEAKSGVNESSYCCNNEVTNLKKSLLGI